MAVGLNYITFNHDHSLLAVGMCRARGVSRRVTLNDIAGTTRGLRVYSTDPFELTNYSFDGDISIAEQLFSTSLFAMVLTPRLMRIVNTKVGRSDETGFERRG